MFNIFLLIMHGRVRQAACVCQHLRAAYASATGRRSLDFWLSTTSCVSALILKRISSRAMLYYGQDSLGSAFHIMCRGGILLLLVCDYNALICIAYIYIYIYMYLYISRMVHTLQLMRDHLVMFSFM